MSPVFLISDEGEKIGEVPLQDALAKAKEKNLDLVEVSPNISPPVCKIMDFGKHLYEMKKKEKKQKKPSSGDMKSLRLGFRTEEHDFNLKIQKAKKFLGKNLKVKIQLMFRGREIQHKELGQIKMNKFAEELSEIAELESPPKLQGRNMTMILNPSKK